MQKAVCHCNIFLRYELHEEVEDKTFDFSSFKHKGNAIRSFNYSSGRICCEKKLQEVFLQQFMFQIGG